MLAKSKILTLLIQFFVWKKNLILGYQEQGNWIAKAGKPLLGKDSAFAPLLESILNVALEGEMDTHFTEEERQMGNRRNGKMQSKSRLH